MGRSGWGGAWLAVGWLSSTVACGSYRPKAHEDGDAGVPVESLDAGPPPCASADAQAGYGGGDWLHTHCNKVLRADGTPWMARGANLPDTRGCDACTQAAPQVGEVLRRLDLLTDGWGATLVRLDLESYAAAGSRVQWKGLLEDAAYFADVKAIVAHAAKKPGVYLVLSPWLDPTLDASGWPTPHTHDALAQLATAFAHEPRVLLSVAAAPSGNLDGALDPQAWAALDSAVAAIRAAEDAAHGLRHVVLVPGLGGYARRVDYFERHPIAAGAGQNVAYEVHPWNPQADFGDLIEKPAGVLPLLIGEFGPASLNGGTMTAADTTALIDEAERLTVPWLAWTFHMRCPPNLLVDNSAGHCGVGMPLQPTEWGAVIQDRLARARGGGHQ